MYVVSVEISLLIVPAKDVRYSSTHGRPTVSYIVFANVNKCESEEKRFFCVSFYFSYVFYALININCRRRINRFFYFMICSFYDMLHMC